MNTFFRRLPLPVKLILIGLIPLLFLVFLTAQLQKEKSEKIQVIHSYMQRIDQSATIGLLVDELQLERRYSFGYAVKKDWRGELVVQRPKTDAALEKLQKVAHGPLENIKAYTFLNELPAVRSDVDNNKLSPAGVMNAYTNILFRLNTLNVVSSGTNNYLEPVNKELISQKLLSEMITYLGILRSNIYQALYSGQNTTQTIESLTGVYKLYKSYEIEFLQKSSPATIAEYQNEVNTGNLKAANAFLDQTFKNQRFDTSYTPENWWSVSAAGTDQLKTMQRNLLRFVQEGVNNIYRHEQEAQRRVLIILIAIIVLVSVLISYTIKVITNMLNELKVGAQKIANGATGLDFHITSNDVVGSLARSISKIDENNKVLADAADAIGSGNFSVVVQPRSKEDLLGNAVVKMKEDLQQYREANREKLWLQEGIVKISESLSGEKDLAALASDALDALATYVQGNMGLLYVASEDTLQYAAGFAVENTDAVATEIKFGETLVGQAALKKEIQQVAEIPADYIKIKSASGSTIPRHLLIVPLIHNGIVEGVVELGSLKEFPATVLTFINEVQPSIAIALQSVKNRIRLQQLFEQTQAQAEELQAQHSELEHINTELEAQTQKLQASEEELKVQQEELLQANQELEERSRLLEERNQLIVERNLEIQQKAEELAISTKYKSEFLANMSHELRTPLNSILLLSRLLSENNEKNLSHDQIEYAQVIQSSGQGLLSLIDEILDLSKIEAGKMELEYSAVSVEEIAGDMKALFTPIAKEKNLRFSVDVDANVPALIETDKMRLEQILKNLLSNALKFTAHGSVNLQISGLKDQATFVAFTVKDTGIGIPKEKQHQIFEAFQQADGSTRRKYGGTGLGLSISRELTKLLGGEIRVSSEPGKGSEFTVYIPKMKLEVQPAEADVLAPAFSEPVKEEEEVKKEKGGDRPRFTAPVIPESLPDDRSSIAASDKVILIVEDDTAFAKALLEYTHSKGYKGLVAVRGDEGIALAQQYKPLGILLDIQLPVKDGWEVMEELKQNPQTRHIPVHIMSSLEVKKESLMKGAVDFINKPVAFEQMQEIFKKIEQVLTKENKKVLIVEENSRHAKALAYFLETFDVSAQISNNVDEGVNALQKEDVDCVILDMGIPDQKAYETLERVKKNPGLEHLPIIIFTGKSLSKAEESRIKQYADSIVVKTAHSYQRILDEVSLFLHLVEEARQPEKRPSSYRKLGALNEVLAGKKILIADDDVRNIFSLTKALEVHNMQVFSAIDGKEALRQLEEHPDMDVVLMDIMMPEMDGYEAMQQIRRQIKFRNLPIIAVTAKAMTGDREKCIKAGASDYISKPVDVDQLLSLLRVWLYDKGF